MALFNIGMDRTTKKLYTGVRSQVDSVAFLLDFTSFFQDPLVRIPSCALFIGWNFLDVQGIPAFLILWDFCWSRVNGNNECFFMRCMQVQKILKI